MSEIISFEDVTIFQDERPVVGGVNLRVGAGEFVYLLGKTGSGKSSFLRTLYGDIPLKGGKGKVCGYDLVRLKQREIPFLRRKLGVVFQDFQLLGDRSVFQNLRFVMKATGWRQEEKIRERIHEVLGKVALDGKDAKMPNELSGGEQQRVAIARALINDPDLIIADEPTGNLDPETSEEILNLLKDLSKSGKAVLFATHDMLVYSKYRSRTLMFENGRVMEKG